MGSYIWTPDHSTALVPTLLMALEALCGVCGTIAPGYNLYGSSTVCLKCRQFFIRSAKSNASFSCAGGSLCDITKCRRCRFDKCLSVGMKPELVRKRKYQSKKKLSEAVNHAQVGFLWKDSLTLTKLILLDLQNRRSFQLKMRSLFKGLLR